MGGYNLTVHGGDLMYILHNWAWGSTASDFHSFGLLCHLSSFGPFAPSDVYGLASSQAAHPIISGKGGEGEGRGGRRGQQQYLTKAMIPNCSRELISSWARIEPNDKNITQDHFPKKKK